MKQEESLTNLIGYYVMAGLTAAILLGVFVIKPAYNKAQATGQQVAVEKAKVKQLQQLQKDTEALRQNYNQPDSTGQTIKQQRDRILAQLPTAVQEERLMVQLNDLASQNGVALVAYSPSLPQPGAAVSSSTTAPSGPYQTLPVTLQVTGTYIQIQNFFAKVEQASRFVDFKGVTLTAGQRGGLTSTVNLQAYFQQSDNGGQQ